MAAALGALPIGLLIGTFLFGISTAQTWIYYKWFPDDHLATKSLVAVVWVLDFAHSTMTSYYVYSIWIEYYGAPGFEGGKPYTCLYVTFLLCVVLVFIVQTFFSYRIYQFMDRSILGIICLVLSFTQFIAAVVLVVEIFRQPKLTFTEVKLHYFRFFVILLGGGAGIDVIIAVSLCSIFTIRRNTDTYTHKTGRILDSLILWTLQTGLTTSITATSVVITAKTMPKSFVWLGIFMFLEKLYSNSLLASLNHRKQLRVYMNTGITLPSFRTFTRSGMNADGRIPPVTSIDLTTLSQPLPETANSHQGTP